MKKRIAINGFGRIGRLVFRNLMESGKYEVTAINDLSAPETLAHLLKYDSAHGVWRKEVSHNPEALFVDGEDVLVFNEKDPARLPWSELGIDLVLECTGVFRTKEGMEKHLKAGAKKVLLSAPAKEGGVLTIVEGVNDQLLNSEVRVLSNASCTTNCLAPVAKVLHENFEIESGFMTTVHAYTADQNLQDAPHKDLRRARAAANSIIPTTTGATQALGLVLPELEGKLTGMAMRVPVITGSSIELHAVVKKAASVDQINKALKNAATGGFNGIIEYTEAPLVSTDIIGNPAGAIVNGDLTEVNGSLIRVVAWYDNEGGYAARLASLAGKVLEL